MAARYYSLRRLSPYQGTAQVVELSGFRAMSVDGVRWRVQFLNQPNRLSSYAVWREGGGGNLIETDHTRAIVEALRARPALPFPLADSLELWLLDAVERWPLALIASTLPERTPSRTRDRRWVSGLSGEDGFRAASLSSAGTTHMPHQEVLDRCIQRAAGPRAEAQWFRREPDGGGVALADSAAGATGPRLPATSFPELLLREDWGSDRETALVRDYHEWHAPSLLTHTGLPARVRERLEPAACRRAEALFRVRRLLPIVVNEELVRVALVEAMIRGAA